MPSYKNMYTELLFAAEKAIEILEEAIVKGESMYLESFDEDNVIMISDKKQEENNDNL